MNTQQHIKQSPACAANKILDTHVAGRLLSPLGRRIFFPDGIVAQTEQSAQARIKATAGMALLNGKPTTLPFISSMLQSFSPVESVSYAPVAGVSALRTEWRDFLLRKNPSLNKNCISMPMVTCGITHGIRTVLDMFLGPGEELITPDKFWENYQHIIETALGGTLRTFPMFATSEAQESFNIAGMQQAMEKSVAAQNKIILLLNFPNNPTGYSVISSEVARMKDAVLSFAQRDIPVLILCDDAYFGLFYGKDVFKESMFSVFAGLHKNVLTAKLDGATKELFSWGFRVGFITIGASDFSDDIQIALELKLKGLLRAGTTSAPRLSQSVVLKTVRALTGAASTGNASKNASVQSELDEQYTILKDRYETTIQAIVNAAARYPKSGLSPYPCNSGYFISFKCDAASAEALRTHLLSTDSIALIALGNILRFTFSAVDAPDIACIIDTLYKEAQKLSST